MCWRLAILIIALLSSVASVNAEGGLAGPEISDIPQRLVFAYSESNCEKLDVPDAPVRAFRRWDGLIVARASHYQNYEYLGTSLGKLVKDCRSTYSASRDTDPSRFDYMTWITSTWTENGRDVVALGHTEFHGNEIPNACSRSELQLCWYNSVVLLISHDGGNSFTRADYDKNQAVFSPFFDNKQAECGRRGYFDPTNMIRVGSYVYTLVGYTGLTRAAHGLCLARARDPFEISSWEIYSTGGYVTPALHPFLKSQGAKVNGPECSVLEGLDGVVGSIGKLRGTDWFVASLMRATPDGGGVVQVYFSKNLINWQPGDVIVRLSTFWSKECRSGYRYNYPSLLDGDGGENFSELGASVELYLTRATCDLTLDRDLVAVKVSIKAPL